MADEWGGDEFQKPYAAWKANRNPETAGAVLTALHPTLKAGIGSVLGPGEADNSTIVGKAKILALGAMDTHDPTKSEFGTHLFNHLQGLRRYARDTSSGTKIPERTFFLKRRISAEETSLEHELGRPPSTAELSERLKVSPEHIAKARRHNSGVSTGMIADPETGAEASIAGQPRKEARDMWANVVHSELDPHHQLVMEHSLGMFGRPVLSNQDLAAKLKKSPGAISQAKGRIQAMLDREQDLSPFLGG